MMAEAELIHQTVKYTHHIQQMTDQHIYETMRTLKVRKRGPIAI